MYFPPFITARMGQKIGRRPQTQLCGAALIAVTQFPDLPFSLLPIRPYTLICSEALYQAAMGPPAYGYVEVLGDPAAVSYQTDLALSRISTGLTFSNFRLQRQSWRQQLLLQLILALVLGLSCLMLVSILRYGLENRGGPAQGPDPVAAVAAGRGPDQAPPRRGASGPPPRRVRLPLRRAGPSWPGRPWRRRRRSGPWRPIPASRGRCPWWPCKI